MNRYLAGFLGGLIGGFVRLGLERIAFASNLTNVNMIQIMGRMMRDINAGTRIGHSWPDGFGNRPDRA